MKFVDSVDFVDRPRLEKMKNVRFVYFVPFVPKSRLSPVKEIQLIIVAKNVSKVLYFDLKFWYKL